MSQSTDVTIQTQVTQVKIQSSALHVSVINKTVIDHIIGIPSSVGQPGKDGADGVAGPKGDTGIGLLVGGETGQILVKQSDVDFNLTWSTHFKIDPVTGNAGFGTDSPQAPLHAKGEDQALVLENSLAPNTFFTIAPGRSGVYEDNLIITRGKNIQNVSNYLLRFTSNGTANFEKGLGIKDGKKITSNTSGALAYYNLFDGRKGSMSFRGAGNSGKAEFRIGSYYHDGVWHSVNVGTWVADFEGGKLGVNTNSPSTTLHINGPARVGSYTVTTMPDAGSTGTGAIIYVSDEVDGAVIAFSDGIDWRRMTDRVVVS